MAKISKIQTPDWVLEGFESKAEYEKSKGLDKKKKVGKTFKVKKCPKCGSYDVGVVLSGSDSEEESNTGKHWECRKCKWTGVNIKEDELTEDEFMEYLDEKGEEVA